ncbi:hypothetical protein SESBI_26405 [Sesbania bispinosa]|nr:hypothetical protein SESBI_26405 [Sesbania bispinosa]
MGFCLFLPWGKEDLSVKRKVKLWWKKVGSRFDKGLKTLDDDKDVVELATFAKTHQFEVEVYVEHLEGGEGSLCLVSGNVQSTSGNVRIDGGSLNDINGVGGEVENDVSSDDSVSDVHFDDNEEERVLGMDDGFDKAGVGDAEAALNLKTQNMLKTADEVCSPEENTTEVTKKKSGGRRRVNERDGEGSFHPHEESDMGRIVVVDTFNPPNVA